MIVDNILMGLVDIQIAFPFTLMALLAVAVFGTDLTIFVIIIGLAGWDTYARVVRGQVLAIRDAPFIDAVQRDGRQTPTGSSATTCSRISPRPSSCFGRSGSPT